MCVCVLQIKPFFLPVASSTTSVRADSAIHLEGFDALCFVSGYLEGFDALCVVSGYLKG